MKFWSPKHLKGITALKRIINPTRIPIEEKVSFKSLENIRQATDLLQRPTHCIHVGDREGDIFELFCTAREAGTKFLVRTCVDRLAKDGGTTLNRVMRRVEVKGIMPHFVSFDDETGQRMSNPAWQNQDMKNRSDGEGSKMEQLTEGLTPNQIKLMASIFAGTARNLRKKKVAHSLAMWKQRKEYRWN